MDKKREVKETIDESNLKTESKQKKKAEIKKLNLKFKFMKDTYIGYGTRIIILAILFCVLFTVSFLFVSNFLTIDDEKVVNYRENGSLDYKVYLKPNEFYEQPYLGRDMLYVASLIKNIDLNFNYQFMISETKNLDFNYSIVANLKITDQSEANVYYQKEYTLLNNKEAKLTAKNQYAISENVSIDYDYYNQIANNFKTSYGVDGVSNLTIYLKINKNVMENETSILNNGNSMSVKIPLSQKALNISFDDSGINTTNNIVTKKSVTFNNALFAILAVVFFIGAVAALLRTLELLALLFPKKSNYDKQVDKILKEYDRLIVETPTVPDLTDKNIIKIRRFEELLDARDNLKLPIMYHNLINHQKCYFYIRQEDTVYLMTLKAADADVIDQKKNKK
ncbi:MAG: hypothetical protein IJY25_04660 [Bacilli bacterium]|nr:hypothetical protein [Bacilli bacterium]